MSNDPVFFWYTSSPFSQWHRSPFTVDGIVYNCAEKWMMAEKARLFGDEQSRYNILHTEDARAIKDLGRKIKNFDEEIWKEHRFDIVVKGNMEKFSQSEKLKKKLLSTGDRLLAEASPYDSIWGIGLCEEAAKTTPIDKWPGLNLLGKALMVVREILS